MAFKTKRICSECENTIREGTVHFMVKDLAPPTYRPLDIVDNILVCLFQQLLVGCGVH
jgi:hypothetical protein